MIHSSFGPASEIDDRHWQGGFPIYKHWGEIRRHFDVLVLCAEELQPSDPLEAQSAFPGVITVCAPMDDDDESIREGDKTVAAEAAKTIIHHLDQDHRVLVTCQAGRNRSGTVSALVLMARRGITGDAAVALVRARRPKALSNEGMCAWIRGLR